MRRRQPWPIDTAAFAGESFLADAFATIFWAAALVDSRAAPAAAPASPVVPNSQTRGWRVRRNFGASDAKATAPPLLKTKLASDLL